MLATASDNPAAELGPRRIPWWKDWRGQCVAIVASGPSTNRDVVAELRDRIHVVAIKANVDLCPWADVVYGCDRAWWISRAGLPKFNGLKLTYDPVASAMFAGLHRIEIRSIGQNKNYVNDLLFDEPGVIGAGANSGFQALNIAVQFGATGILLIGFDFDVRSGVHWYGRNTWGGANNPDAGCCARWIKHLTAAAPSLSARGIDVVNASQNSALQCFRKASVADALRQWGL